MVDWQVGDAALCIGRGGDDVYRLEGVEPVARGPVVGLTYTVAGVMAAFDCYGRPGVALRFVEIAQKHPRSCGYNAELFQRANHHTPDAEDAETIALLNGAPAVVEA